MSASARLTDIWTGICCCHSDPTCISMGGRIISSSGNIESVGLGQGRLSDLTIGWCGHPGNIVSGSPNVQANSLGAAYIGSTVYGCNIGQVVTGAANHQIN